jgi:hypothetical protein
MKSHTHTHTHTHTHIHTFCPAAQGVYVAGFTDPNCVSFEDHYDLLVDLESNQVLVSVVL